ncbi:MAG: ThiF family adenylyltransferase [Verrucomicrobia bacterium]|nr:ThiF family adenylyltransferase [Verrucomicrobiota bacterium]
MNYIIGCGGVGSAIVPSFCLLKSPAEVTLIDGDTIERKNLNRQMFDVGQIGMNKAQALAGRYGCHFIGEWFARGKLRHYRNDWLLCLVDNHRTRLETLEVCDDYGCQAIFAANEMHSAEAYFYRRAWKGTQRDPRVYYPELTTDRSGDPRAISVGCTGEAQENNRQLVSANLMAAALAEHLFVLWSMKAPRMDRETIELLPHKFATNLTKLETYSLKGGHHE